MGKGETTVHGGRIVLPTWVCVCVCVVHTLFKSEKFSSVTFEWRSKDRSLHRFSCAKEVQKSNKKSVLGWINSMGNSPMMKGIRVHSWNWNKACEVAKWKGGVIWRGKRKQGLDCTCKTHEELVLYPTSNEKSLKDLNQRKIVFSNWFFKAFSTWRRGHRKVRPVWKLMDLGNHSTVPRGKKDTEQWQGELGQGRH